jgi:hypothetical protein
MVIDNHHIVGVSIPEAEDDSKLIVDSNTVEPPPGSLESFQPVPGRHAQVAQVMRRIQEIELPHGDALQGRWQSCPCGPGVDPMEEIFGGSVPEAGDHERNLLL